MGTDTKDKSQINHLTIPFDTALQKRYEPIFIKIRSHELFPRNWMAYHKTHIASLLYNQK